MRAADAPANCNDYEQINERSCFPRATYESTWTVGLDARNNWNRRARARWAVFTLSNIECKWNGWAQRCYLLYVYNFSLPVMHAHKWKAMATATATPTAHHTNDTQPLHQPREQQTNHSSTRVRVARATTLHYCYYCVRRVLRGSDRDRTYGEHINSRTHRHRSFAGFFAEPHEKIQTVVQQ